MKYLKEISRILVGIVFIFSGFVKAIDPLGSMYKFSDYFDAFHMAFLNDLALPFAIILNVAELMIGIALFLKLRIRLTAWVAVFFMGFFTLLTLVLAIFNPVSDCGCFGDAIKLSNWGTFYKNLILIGLVFHVFFKRKNFKTMFPIDVQWIWVGLSLGIGLFISVYSFQHLPVLDFRPYHVGVNIPNAMIIPDDAEPDQYETTLIYEKEGTQKEFSLENYPAEDTTWVFVDQNSKLVKKGYEAPIHDFMLFDSKGIDYSEDILNSQDYNFIFCAKNLAKVKSEDVKKLKALEDYSKRTGINYYWITSNSWDKTKNFKRIHGLSSTFYNMDQTTLKTIVRANPGVLLIKDGTIIGKWHVNDLPEFEKENIDLLSFVLSDMEKLKERQFITILLFLFLASILSFQRFLKGRLKA